MADSRSFELASTQLERATDLDRLEARGTLRLALKAVHFDSRTVDARQLRMVVERVLPDELVRRGIEDAATVCRRMSAALEDLEGSGEELQSPDAVFGRLIRR